MSFNLLSIPKLSGTSIKADSIASSSPKISTRSTSIKTKVISFIGIPRRFFLKIKTKLGINPIGTNNNLEKPKRFIKVQKYLRFFLLILALVFILVVGYSFIKKRFESPGVTTQSEVKGTISSINIDKEFSFPLMDSKGKEVSRIVYTVQKAELRDEIIVKGQKATAVEGRAFLILTLKIVNQYKQSININSRDYVRLSVNGNKNDWLAPDIHNDPLEIQAISTKYTRLGFPISLSDKDLILRIGEIDGEKQEYDIKF